MFIDLVPSIHTINLLGPFIDLVPSIHNINLLGPFIYVVPSIHNISLLGLFIDFVSSIHNINLLGLFRPEYEGTTVLQNMGNCWSNGITSQRLAVSAWKLFEIFI